MNNKISSMKANAKKDECQTVLELYEQGLLLKAFKIREFERHVLLAFQKGKMSGTTHVCIGQEMLPVFLSRYLDIKKDFVFTGHRGHGHFLAYTDDYVSLFDELFGNEDGCCGGRCGSQHLRYDNFYTNGIQGGIAPNATGAGFYHKHSKENATDAISVAIMGDGTMGQGVVYESLNLAALWDLPVLFIIEDNGIAISTKKKESFAGNFVSIARGFGMYAWEISDKRLGKLDEVLDFAVSYVRERSKPFFLVVETQRLYAHSKGDDTRDKKELASLKDPFNRIREIVGEEKYKELQNDAENFIAEKLKESEEKEPLKWIRDIDYKCANYMGTMYTPSDPNLTQRENLNMAIDKALSSRNDIFMFGQDIKDPYGGAFKVTKGLSTKHPDKVFNTPISEAATVGLAVGICLAGGTAIVEIMFSDFLTLAADQIINHAAKYRWVANFDGERKKPWMRLMIRTASGLGGGYGLTHSQSLSSLFYGIPGVVVLEPTEYHDWARLFHLYLECGDPVIFVENKCLYDEKYVENVEFYKRTPHYEGGDTQEVKRFTRENSQAVIVARGADAWAAFKAADQLLYEYDINVDIWLTSILNPVNDDLICYGELSKQIIVIVDSIGSTYGFSHQIYTQFHQYYVSQNEKIFSADKEQYHIPGNAKLENYLHADVDMIVWAIKRKLKKDD